MIIYMNVPSEDSRRRSMGMPSSKTITGYACDDCLSDQGWGNVLVKEDYLRNLLAAEKRERWDVEKGCFLTGLHLCRPHAIKRRWQTDQYRNCVMDAIIPIMKSEEYRLKKIKSGKYSREHERRQARLDEIRDRLLAAWSNKCLDFASIPAGELLGLMASRWRKDKRRRYGLYEYSIEFESWVSRGLSLPAEHVHAELFSQWLERNNNFVRHDNSIVVVNGVVNGRYVRYHGNVITDLVSVSFSSLLELSFILHSLSSGSSIRRATKLNGFAIPYMYDKNKKTYFPDFIVDDSLVIEVKDSREVNSDSNIAKQNASLPFCRSRGYQYQVVTENDIPQDTMRQAWVIVSEWLQRSSEKQSVNYQECEQLYLFKE